MPCFGRKLKSLIILRFVMRNRTDIRQISKAAGMIALVVLYLLSAIGPGSIHHFLHQENPVALHLDQNEIDPCHRKIYHNDTQAGCKHNSHISGQIKCQVCTSISFKDHLYVSTATEDLPRLHQARFIAEAYAVIKQYNQLLSSRGPPAIPVL